MNNSQQIELDAFTIVGIAVRTTNQHGQSQVDIGQLWQKFIQEKTIDKIPTKSLQKYIAFIQTTKATSTAPIPP